MNNSLSNIIDKIKMNKIIFLVIIIFFLIFLVIFIDISKNDFNGSLVENKNIDPYVFVIKGQAIIKRDKIITIKENYKENIQIGDRIRTLGNSSAVIFWPDESITRLGEKTSIKITTMDIAKDLSKIQIKFDISEGKTWSNIIHYLANDESYFTETYENKNLAATVRGTIFEINVENGYINAVDHTIKIEDSTNNKIVNLQGGNTVQIGNINKFIKEKFLDTSWIDWNKNQDNIYIKKLVENYKNQLITLISKENYLNKISRSIGFKDNSNIDITIKDIIVDGKIEKIKNIENNIENLNGAQLKVANKFLLDLYQKVNYYPNTEENISLKTQLRDIIIKTSSPIDKNKFIKDFTKLNLFDYIDATNKGLKNSKDALNKKIIEYANLAGQENMMNEVLESFNKSGLEKIKTDFSSLSQSVNIALKKLVEENYMQGLQNQIIKDAKNLKENILNIYK